MDDAAKPDTGLFDGGPPLGLQRRLHLIPAGRPYVGRRAGLVILIGWLPLLILAAAQTLVGDRGVLGSFLSDIAVHTRTLVSAPLLVLAEAVCTPRLSHIAHHFYDAGLVRPEDHRSFGSTVNAIARWRDSVAAEIIIVALAYALVAAIVLSAAPGDLPGWHSAGTTAIPWAAWWYGAVSLPLLLILLLGWVWRLMLWTGFLSRIARLNLCLVSSHPDQTSGLRFVGYSLRAFGMVGFILGTIVAGAMANGVLHDGIPLAHYRYVVAALALFSLILFCGPLLLLLPPLLREWREGIFRYGALAGRLGREFENKWLRDGKVDAGALQAPDFSATTDLYQIAGNVYSMRLIPFDLKSVLLLVIATLLPLLPVLLLAVPVDTVLSKITSLLL
jgi:hypothetical protein